MRRDGWIAIALLAAIGGVCQAATVRGKLLRGTAPAPGVTVTVVNTQSHASAAPVTSGQDGMYYIPNVKVGTYTLEVWATPGRPPVKYPNIQVKNPVTDVGPITVH
jgi:hypothetical protein